MSVHPQCQAVLDAAAKAPTAFDTDDPVEARRRYDAGTPAFATPSPPLAEVANGTLPGPARAVPYRLYRPNAGGGAPLPTVAFFHGGGWIFGGLDSHDHVCRELAHQAGALVVSVDYRLAPEHKFPAAFEDCLAATRWLRDNATGLGGDASRLAVAGDSAGGNLAAAVCLALRDASEAQPVFQYLIYPAVDLACESDSHQRLGEGYLLTKDGIDHCVDSYLNTPGETEDPRVSPLKAGSLAGLPAALVQTAGFDPLCDEGKAFADRLATEGVAATHTRYDGMIHGFARMGAVVDAAAEAIAEGAGALRTAFQGAPEPGSGS